MCNKGRWNHDYQTDSFHNRRKKNGLAYQTNVPHQLLSQGEPTYRYDPNGNLIAKQERGDLVALVAPSTEKRFTPV